MEEISITEENVVRKVKKKFLQRKGIVFSLFNVATFIEYFSLQFLSSSMRALEMSLGLTPTQVSSFTMAETFGLVSSFPIWGVLSDKIELKYIMIFGVMGSGALSIWISGISNITLTIILRVLNGAMMGSVTPSTQKYVVNYLKTNMVIGFGIMHSVMCAARMASSVIVTTFSTGTYFNRDGWRICLFGFGSVSLILSPIFFLIPNFNKIDGDKIYDKIKIKDNLIKLRRYLWSLIKESLGSVTAFLMVLLTFFSDGPFVAFNYVTLLIQYMGLSNIKSGVTASLVIVGGIVGGILGGFVSQYFDKKSKKYGLLLFGNFNVVIRIITFGIAFGAITPKTVDRLYPLLVVCLFINGMTFMTVSCVDRSIVANVIRCVSGMASTLTFNPILTKIREDGFGFEKTLLDVKDMPEELLLKNSNALRYSISIVAISTTVVVFILYFVVCFTYNKDCQKVKRRIELESQGVETLKQPEITV